MTFPPICLAHKLVPPGFWPASPEHADKSLLMTCVLPYGHPSVNHICGDFSWTRGAEDCESLGCTHPREARP